MNKSYWSLSAIILAGVVGWLLAPLQGAGAQGLDSYNSRGEHSDKYERLESAGKHKKHKKKWKRAKRPRGVSCGALVYLNLRDAVVTLSEEIPAGEYTPPGAFAPLTDLPAFCRVAITVEPAINIEVWLPAETWNGRYQGVGGGGYAGSISYGALANAIRDGYAAASTDTGHLSSEGGRFALNEDGSLNSGLIEDFAERSLYEMVIKAKRIIRKHYGERPKYSYWTGCSTGGRQGLMAVQRFPEQYDGFVIAAPAINWDRFIPAELWPQIVMYEALGGPMNPEKLEATNAAAVAACDPLDGVVDGVINDPRKCDYDPVSAMCPFGDPETCLTAVEASVVRKIWEGPKSEITGEQIWFGLEPGATLAIPFGLASGFVFPIATEHLQYWVKQDPSFDFRTLTERDFEDYLRESVEKFNHVIGTDDVNLRRLRNGKTKVLMWHGETDQLIFPRGTINYYLRVLAANDSRRKPVSDYMRLFMAPGVDHCAGGVGPNPVGLLDSVVDWVENDIAPDTILATKSLPDGTELSRPLCQFPQTAEWDGIGNTNLAESFQCVDGDQDLNDFAVDGEFFRLRANETKRDKRRK